MARDLKLNIAANSEEARKHVAEMAASVDLLAHESNKLGDEFRKAARDAEELDIQLVKTKAEARLLAAEFAKTQDPAIKKQYQAQASVAKDLEKLRGNIVGDTEKDAKRAVTAWEKGAKDLKKVTEELLPGNGKTFQGFGEGLGALGEAGATPYGLAAIGGVAPAVLSGAGGLLGGLTGAGVAGAGVAGAAMGDPKEFGAAWKAVTSQLKTDFISATSVFQGPGLAAIRTIGETIHGWDLKGIFASAVQYVGPLVAGAERMATGIIHGIGELTSHAGPEVAVLAAEMGKLGESVDLSLSLIAGDATGGAEGMHALFLAVEGAIVGVGILVRGAEDLVNGITGASNAARNFFNGIPGWVKVAIPPLELYTKLFDAFTPDTADAAAGAKSFGRALDGVAVGADGAVGKMDDLGTIGGSTFISLEERVAATNAQLERMNQDFDKAISNALGLSNADIQAAQAMADLAKGFKKGSDALDIGTQKGRDNMQLINSLIAAYQEQRDKAIAAGNGTADAYAKANAVYDQALGHLEAMLIKLGLSKGAADQLLAAFHDKTFTITENVNVKVHTTGPVDAQGVVTGGIPRSGAYASGTSYASGGWSLVGEEGPEMINLPAGSKVKNAADTRHALDGFGSKAGSGGGGNTIAFSGPTTGLEGLFLSWLVEASRDGRVRIHNTAIV